MNESYYNPEKASTKPVKKLEDLKVGDVTLIKVKKGKDGQEIESEILEAKDELLTDAFYKATKKSNKETYLGHVSLLVISEKLANNGINDVINYLTRELKARFPSPLDSWLCY